jgi:DNA polymerase III subunit epsilon
MQFSALSSNSRQQAILNANNILKHDPVFLDTETTGLDKNAEIVEIAIVDNQGNILFEQLFKPSQPIPPNVTRINGITNDMVMSKPSWAILWPEIRSHIYGRTIGMYNAGFDLRMMQQSLVRYNLPWKDKFNTFDIMKLYAQYQGVWDPKRGSYKNHKLEAAGNYFNIPIPNSHRAAEDTLLTRAVFLHLSGNHNSENPTNV